MKAFLLLIWFIFIFCFIVRAQGGFKIVGQLDKKVQGVFILMADSYDGPIKLGEAKVKKGGFEFSGTVEDVMPAYILTENKKMLVMFMLENADYTLSKSGTGIEFNVGGESQKIWKEYSALTKKNRNAQLDLEKQAKFAYSDGNQVKMQELQQQFARVVENGLKEKYLMYEKYNNSPVTAFMIALDLKQMDYKILNALYNILGETAKQSLYGKVISQRLEQIKKLEIGAIAPDFEAITINDEAVSLHKIPGKLKLIDFWASWCGPCKQEIPNVCNVYNKYKEKGLEIVGVSLDDKRESWEQAVNDWKMTWINVSDLRGWKSEIATLYGIESIPFTLLLDENNRIIAKNLRGKELEQVVESLLNEEMLRK